MYVLFLFVIVAAHVLSPIVLNNQFIINNKINVIKIYFLNRHLVPGFAFFLMLKSITFIPSITNMYVLLYLLL